MEELVLSVLRRMHALEASIVGSDYVDVIESIRMLDRNIAVYLGGVTPAGEHDVVLQARKIRADMIKVKNTYVTPALVRYAHDHHVGIYACGRKECPI